MSPESVLFLELVAGSFAAILLCETLTDMVSRAFTRKDQS